MAAGALADRTADAFAGVVGRGRGSARSRTLWQVERAETLAHRWDEHIDGLQVDAYSLDELASLARGEGPLTYLGSRLAGRFIERTAAQLIAARAPAVEALTAVLSLDVKLHEPSWTFLGPDSSLMRCAASLDRVDRASLTELTRRWLQDHFAVQAYYARGSQARRGTDWRELAPQLGVEAYVAVAMCGQLHRQTLMGLCYEATVPELVTDPDAVRAKLRPVVTAFARSLVPRNAGDPDSFGYTYPACRTW